MKAFLSVVAFLFVLVLFVSCGRREDAGPGGGAMVFLKASDLPGLLSEARGKRAVLLVFWATWCPPCAREVPDLNHLHGEWGKRGLDIIAVNIGEAEGRVAGYARKKGIRYRILLDETSSLAREYGVVGIPLNVLISPDGNTLYRGHLLGEEFRKALSGALGGVG